MPPTKVKSCDCYSFYKENWIVKGTMPLDDGQIFANLEVLHNYLRDAMER